MVQLNFGTDFILACIFLGATVLMGIFTLFARAENIERPFVVGALSLAGSLFGMILLDHLRRTELNFGFGSLVAVCVVSLLGFALGRVLDWSLGPRPFFQADDESLDTNLAD